ncbi:MAG: hypothetical protein M3R53_09055 [Candidatus Eremiobacteraeota bacterium]|nr:hypothetical protein [Candidatus Eremiobacteraeota bacterium]
MTVEIVDLGAWGGAALLAEFDAERDAVAVNLRAVARVRAVLGEAEARRFVACAVAHERYHRAHPGSSEAAAHAHAHAVCGVDPRRYEAALRGLV